MCSMAQNRFFDMLLMSVKQVESGVRLMQQLTGLG